MKLSRKGFTLIELLAVVVIMGIILVITIPSVLNTTSAAKEKQLRNAANTAAEWYNKQQQLYSLDKNELADESYKNFLPNTEASGIARIFYSSSGTEEENEKRKAGLIAAGLSDLDANFELGKSKIIRYKGKICIMLVAKQGGSFYVSGGVNAKCSSTCAVGLNGIESKSASGITCDEVNF